jgi:hypothetical protein
MTIEISTGIVIIDNMCGRTILTLEWSTLVHGGHFEI